MMKYAEVAVDAPVSHSRTFSYSIPHRFRIQPGQLVWVPFGRRTLQGVVMELTPAPAVEVTKDILQPVEPAPLLDDTALTLARWISRYYLCSLFDAVALFLPPGFKAQVRSRVLPVPLAESDLEKLHPETQAALQSLTERKRLSEGEFAKLLGRAGIREVNRLTERGLIHRRVNIPRPRTFRYTARLLPAGARDIGGQWPELEAELSPRQAGLLQAVREREGGYSTTQANKEFGSGVGNALVAKGLLGLEWVRQENNVIEEPDLPEGLTGATPEPPPTLTAMQSDALARIVETLKDPSLKPRTFLLHGVTGSGKTEVYLRAMEWVIARGQQAIFLVPEISLTPQTIQRVNARFPGRVATLHSGLTDRQKFDQWWKIRDGGCDVVVGPRSALFAPLPNLGLIVLDEEHEWTYKQIEIQPFYHARAVALELSGLIGATVVLGSATPDVESYHHARSGRYRLLELPHRIRRDGLPAAPASVVDEADCQPLAPPDGQEVALAERKGEMPRVEVCDMRLELREGNRSIFSRSLSRALEECIGAGQQAILFLNRRGSASIVQCRDCGYVVVCGSCAVSLTYHAADNRLLCHRCNRRSRPPSQCRQCRGSHIRQLGIGTQRVVDEVRELLPGVMVERWDADASRAGPGPEETMRRLARGEIQVLVGTQMVAKGLDVPNITLVGAVLADVGIHLPDFRAGERAFSLLCQVAGRAGRGTDPGRAIIQTYNPEHYAVAAAARQDYAALFRNEIEARHQQGNPPFNRLIHLLYQNTDPTSCQQQAITAARLLRQRIREQGLFDVQVIGPAPGIPERVRGSYRWRLVLRGRNLHRFLAGVELPARDVTIDVDPVHLL